ncbi:hypothetical protein Pla175_26840 [Pirellulimonas nuda]|uniref:DUF5060 domain-containing protein n=1 Tax=Pirellulimonas nuda TaxID=2528009 RepID=A0A518DCT7_9BACT|nr:DUF5060 domain-containing protein [Pirellulimonas nuda]QDU89295.1 hypothetical protein Pla175_26840 [Pirellulimonas nuda]
MLPIHGLAGGVMRIALVLMVAWGGRLQALEVTGLTLVNAQTDLDIGPLTDGQVVDLDRVIWALNVRANTTGDVKSVRFGLDGNPSRAVESVAPFALAGDADGDYNDWTPEAGGHTLTATPFPEAGAKGTPGEPLVVTFRVKGIGRAPAGRGLGPANQTPDVGDAQELRVLWGQVAAPVGGQAVVSGELKQWHNVTLTFDGPQADVAGKPNPCLHYRLNVLFTQGDRRFLAPGYYAGDGRGGDAGNRWRVHFAPPTTGAWGYKASFRAGYQVNVSLDPNAGVPAACDGASGSVAVAPSDKKAPDFRAADRGLLKNRGGHYLTFANGRFWLKGGPDIPENFLGYDGFDNTPKAGHRYEAHAADWEPGDPDWGDGRARRLIGALNAIANLGGNCVYFLPMNIGGDGKDTFPTIDPLEKLRYDHSKLQQWETVFAHAQQKGIFLHFQLAETEDANENYHDNGELGPERKLFYRELIARFGHHNASEFNIGEENDYGPDKQVRFAQYIRDVDPYDHPLTTHTKGVDAFYRPLVDRLAAGKPVVIDMTSFQSGATGKDLARLVQKYRDASAEHGRPWIISLDEPQKIENDKTDLAEGYAFGRRGKLWPTYMGGGGGFEWYVQMDGGGHAFDHKIESFYDMDDALRWTAIAREFLGTFPLPEMRPAHHLGASRGGGFVYVLAKPNEQYAVYSERCEAPLELDLTGAEGRFEVRWLDPRNGGPLAVGTVDTVEGGGKRSLGSPPNQAYDSAVDKGAVDRDAVDKDAVDRDWAVAVRRVE